jgi:hypothetical protein
MSAHSTPVSVIDTYGIKEVHADAGQKLQVNEFLYITMRILLYVKRYSIRPALRTLQYI